MITQDGWFDWMERDPGPPWKVNGGRNTLRGMVPHSAEGYRIVLRDILWGPRRASWHVSVLTDRVIQHYPVRAQTWTSGAGYPNNNFLAGETEGLAGTPFNDFQTKTWIRIGRELMDLGGYASAARLK